MVQQIVRQFQASGMPGDIANSGNPESRVWNLNSDGKNGSTNPFTYAYTQLSDGIATPGGLGAFIGLLMNPKEYTNRGTSAGSLAPKFYLSDNEAGALFHRVEGWLVLATTGNVGDVLTYEVATGRIGTTPFAVGVYELVPTGKIIEQDILTADTTAKIRLTY